jgi:hypothetical protein
MEQLSKMTMIDMLKMAKEDSDHFVSLVFSAGKSFNLQEKELQKKSKMISDLAGKYNAEMLRVATNYSSVRTRFTVDSNSQEYLDS